MENSDDSEVTEGEERNLKEERLFKLPASLPNVAKRIINVNQDSMSIEVLQETADPNRKIQNKEQVIETGSLITQKGTIRSEDNGKLIESSKKENSDEIEKSIEKTAKLKSNPPIPYNEPPWGGHDPPSPGNNEPLYTVEELKNGVIVNKYPLTKSYQVIGRLPICDIQLEHPSLSRYHAVLQFKANSSSDKPAGFYLYDLDSTHGTFHNKHRCFPKTYYRLRVGHGLKFGGSTRLLILQGPLEDSEQESELSVTELKELAILKAKERLYREQSEQKSYEEEESTGISWGMPEDAVEDEPSTDKNIIDPPKNPFLSQKENENIDISDPKKTLRGWFEREGLELEYDCQEVGYAKFKCTVNLPIEDENGISTPKVAEATVSGKKKEAVISCALEACRILDRLGLLRSSTHESRVKRSKKKWEENDYYDSDEDEFLDRTGTLEAKRQKRMNTVKGNQNLDETARQPSKKTVETFDSLCEKRAELSKEILNLEQRIESGKKSMQEMKISDNGSVEDLDMYMSLIEKSADCSKEGLSKMKIKLSSLTSEIKRVERLIEIARPAKLPEKVSTGERCMTNQSDQCDVPKSGVIMIGKMFNRKMGNLKPIPSNSRTTVSTKVNHKHDQGLTYNQEHDDHIPEDSVAAKGKFKMKIEQKMEAKDPESSKARSEFPAEMAEEAKEDKTVVSKNIVNVSMKKKQKRKSDTFSNNVNQNIQSNASDVHEFVQNSDKNQIYEEMSAQDDRYSAWLPPKNQTGDGRTNLNDKFGY